MENLKEKALSYHQHPQPGKIAVVPTKPYADPADLSLAYSPGVAYPCKEIKENPAAVRHYTGRSNLVAVISNGTAVLGLGNIGPLAAKPVMEGKALLFKIYAGLDAFDIELDADDPEAFIAAVKAMTPTFGGINLEDIKAPECFEIERRLREECDIPVMCDSRGVIRADRAGLSGAKKEFATARDLHTLAEALKDADVFLGLSVADVMTKEMLLSMAPKPIVFALANPDPEIDHDLALATRTDLIFATGRSDFSNQINNVLGFPYIFRGALDCDASEINEAMKLAAARAVAAIAHEPATEALKQLYPDKSLTFGPKYILPKPFDKRLLPKVSRAVAQAADESGVARRPLADLDAYERWLNTLIDRENRYLSELMAHEGAERPKL